MSESTEVTIAEMVGAIKTADAIVRGGYGDGDFHQRLVGAVDYIKAAHAALGPKCPKCGGWTKTDHKIQHDGLRYGLWRREYDHHETVGDVTCFTVEELIANHPEIAVELGIK